MEGLSDLAPNFLGTQRSTDASSGEFALQLGADKLFPISDVFSANACNGSLPTTFSIDMKHVGNVADTLTILGAFGEATGLPEDEEQLNNFGALFFHEVIVETSTEYETISIPIESLENEIAADSFTLFMLLTSDEASISMGDTSYFLIDNMQFQGTDNTTSTKELSLPYQVEVYPTVFHQHITIANENEPLEAILYGINGQREATLTIPSGQSQHDLSYINNAGSYVLKMVDPKTGRSTTTLLLKK